MNNEDMITKELERAYGKDTLDKMSQQERSYAAEKAAAMLQEAQYQAEKKQAELRARKHRRIRNPVNPAPPFVRAEQKTGRNEPCPCGSGKKYKKCCGR